VQEWPSRASKAWTAILRLSHPNQGSILFRHVKASRLAPSPDDVAIHRSVTPAASAMPGLAGCANGTLRPIEPVRSLIVLPQRPTSGAVEPSTPEATLSAAQANGRVAKTFVQPGDLAPRRPTSARNARPATTQRLLAAPRASRRRLRPTNNPSASLGRIGRG
jgi:hypothetical protein